MAVAKRSMLQRSSPKQQMDVKRLTGNFPEMYKKFLDLYPNNNEDESKTRTSAAGEEDNMLKIYAKKKVFEKK